MKELEGQQVFFNFYKLLTNTIARTTIIKKWLRDINDRQNIVTAVTCETAPYKRVLRHAGRVICRMVYIRLPRNLELRFNPGCDSTCVSLDYIFTFIRYEITVFMATFRNILL